MNDYDLTIIGSGPGGYVCAIRAAQLGLKVCIVEKDNVGGLCLNWGCIPSKALLRNAEILDLFQHAASFGISYENLKSDYGHAIDRSRSIVDQLTRGIASLLRKNQVTYINGSAEILDKNTIMISEKNVTEKKEIHSTNIVIATGATPKSLPSLPLDNNTVITSKEALFEKKLPAHIVIIGGGATGVEFAFIYRKYGVDVTIIEAMPSILPNEDADISEALKKSLTEQGISIFTDFRITNADITDNSANLTISNSSEEKVLSCDKILVAIGASANIQSLGLENIDIQTTTNGFIEVDDYMSTNVKGIYAIGDVTGKLLLAHVASAQGVLVAETIAGLDSPKIDYVSVPRAVYCQPQVASLGLSEKEAVDQGYDVKIGVFPLSANGKALATEHRNGFVKIVSDSEIGDILGVHMIGHEVTELISHIAMTKLLEGTTQELGWLIHPHPTISETIKEASLATEKQAIHI